MARGPDDNRPLRLMIYDDTCRGAKAPVGLTHTWIAGGMLYRGLGRLDAYRGVRSWSEGLAFLADYESHREIAEVQFWGHGQWGTARIDKEVFDRRVLKPEHPLHELLCAVRARLSGPEALWWFRTCKTFGADKGQKFAKRFSTFLNCRAAGHTFIIAAWQSGLHSLGPGETPTWSADEGIAEGTAAKPKRALWSSMQAPHTISCLRGDVPSGY